MPRYRSLNDYLQEVCGEKIYRIALDAGFTCPNRDGTLGTGGCIFCSAGGSGDYAVSRSRHPDIRAQLDAGRALFGGKRTGQRYIAYFQAYTNTYGPLPYLRAVYTEALRESSVAGISIATRPDCLPENVVTMLVNLREKFPDKFVWVELGLQTIHEKTSAFIRRGYSLEIYDNCVALLRQARIPVVTHVILGLPGETREHVLSTIAHINNIRTWGVKLQLLHVLRGTDLETLFQQGLYEPMTQPAYTDLVIDCLEHLAPDIVVHRLTGDGPKELLLAPLWSADKRNVLNTIQHTMKIRGSYQGRLYKERLFHDAGSVDPIQTDCSLYAGPR